MGRIVGFGLFGLSVAGVYGYRTESSARATIKASAPAPLAVLLEQMDGLLDKVFPLSHARAHARTLSHTRARANPTPP